MSDLLADLLARMERELWPNLLLIGDHRRPLYSDRKRADWLRAHEAELLDALGGEQIGWMHDCSAGVQQIRPGECGYAWCATSTKSGQVWQIGPGDGGENIR